MCAVLYPESRQEMYEIGLRAQRAVERSKAWVARAGLLQEQQAVERILEDVLLLDLAELKSPC